jgi:hypothetical protein
LGAEVSEYIIKADHGVFGDRYMQASRLFCLSPKYAYRFQSREAALVIREALRRADVKARIVRLVPKRRGPVVVQPAPLVATDRDVRAAQEAARAEEREAICKWLSEADGGWRRMLAHRIRSGAHREGAK